MRWDPGYAGRAPGPHSPEKELGTGEVSQVEDLKRPPLAAHDERIRETPVPGLNHLQHDVFHTAPGLDGFGLDANLLRLGLGFLDLLLGFELDLTQLVLSLQRPLLGNHFVFDGLRVLRAEFQVCHRHIGDVDFVFL